MPDNDVPADPSPAVKPRRVNEVPWWTYVVLFPAALTVRLWLMTLRMEGAEGTVAELRREKGPLIVCFWHSRLMISPELRRRYRSFKPMNGLVSASKDGAWLVAFFNLMGIGAIRGSSSWRGGRALVELAAKLKAGEDIAITPDGPRGPCHDFKKGPAALAISSGCPVLLVGSGFSRAKRLKSWDRFALPYPFSKVILRTVLVRPEEFAAAGDDIALAALFREKLIRAEEEAERAAAE